jgi:hypothetical protein
MELPVSTIWDWINDRRRNQEVGSACGVKVEPAVDENGAPLLLVAGAAREVPTRSGNPAHQVDTGQFGAHGKKGGKQGGHRPGRAREEEGRPQAQPDPGRDPTSAAATPWSTQLARSRT